MLYPFGRGCCEECQYGNVDDRKWTCLFRAEFPRSIKVEVIYLAPVFYHHGHSERHYWIPKVTNIDWHVVQFQYRCYLSMHFTYSGPHYVCLLILPEWACSQSLQHSVTYPFPLIQLKSFTFPTCNIALLLLHISFLLFEILFVNRSLSVSKRGPSEWQYCLPCSKRIRGSVKGTVYQIGTKEVTWSSSTQATGNN